MSTVHPFVVRTFGTYRKPVLAQLLIVEIPLMIAFAVSWWITQGMLPTYLIAAHAVGYLLWWAARRYSRNLLQIQQSQ
jgi:hypothetical protein